MSGYSFVEISSDLDRCWIVKHSQHILRSAQRKRLVHGICEGSDALGLHCESGIAWQFYKKELKILPFKEHGDICHADCEVRT